MLNLSGLVALPPDAQLCTIKLFHLYVATQTFGGYTKQFKHQSETLSCEMKFSVYFPPHVQKAPILYYLSGLTCTDRNFVEKVCS